MSDIEVLDDEKTETKNEKQQKEPIKKEKSLIKNIILVITIFLLLTSIGISGYLIYQNKEIDNDLTNLKESITKVETKISGYNSQKEEKQNEYEKLETETKEKIEELNIWKELKEKLEVTLQ